MAPSNPRRILVIGAGPGGLVTAKVLQESEPTAIIIIVEAGDRVGGTFVNKTYEGSRLVRYVQKQSKLVLLTIFQK
jgi:cation diffusion facilitator CzcD-associated flavoprotein CzcO